MLKKNFRVAPLAVRPFMFPEKTMKQQRYAAAGAADNNLEIGIAVKYAAGDHAQTALRDLAIRQNRIGNSRAAIFETRQGGILRSSGAVQKNRQVELGNLREDRVHLRRVHQHLALDMGVEQHGAKTLLRRMFYFHDRGGDILKRER